MVFEDELETTVSVEWKWPGARWWKCDLHTHTPASHDYKQEECTPQEWVRAAIDQGLEVVAVTDHNGFKWIDRIREAAAGRALSVFPGTELTEQGGAHLLILFDTRGGNGNQVRDFLSRCKQEHLGKDLPAKLGVDQILDEVRDHGQGPLLIAAHVHQDKGLFKTIAAAETLKNLLRHPSLAAVEINEAPEKDGEGNEEFDKLLEKLEGDASGYERPRGALSILSGSDAHRPEDIGRRFTWIKMTRPDLEGLRLALQDGNPLSVLSSVCDPDESSEDPNRHASFVIERLEIEEMRYIGRAQGPFGVEFNPWFNAIIGGRGTGKSTLVECLRLALRRDDDELPKALQEQLEDFRSVPEGRNKPGLMTPDAEIRVIYRKDGSRFRIRWRWDGEGPSIEEQEPSSGDGETWKPVPGDIKELFPARIYSQKQIFEMSRDPASLLETLDEAPKVRGGDLRKRREDAENRYLSLSAQIREIEADLAQREPLEGRLKEIQRKLSVFENAGHAGVLRAFRRRQRQEQEIDAWTQELREAQGQIEQTANAIAVELPDRSRFQAEAEGEAGEDDREREIEQLFALFGEAKEQFDRIQEQVRRLAKDAASAITAFENGLEASRWRRETRRARERYDQLTEQLRESGVDDLQEYGQLVQDRRLVESQLEKLGSKRKDLERLEEQRRAARERAAELRRELTRRREVLLQEVLPEQDKQNERGQRVRATVVAYGDRSRVENELREHLEKDGGKTFEKDIGEPGGEASTILGRLYPADGEDGVSRAEFEERLKREKERLRRLAKGEEPVDGSAPVQDERFRQHLQKLPPERLDRLMLWFPEDRLDISYSTDSWGKSFRPLQSGSPGQRTAALLTFLLSYGDDPIILDQPEDDLDNALIYDLVVQRLREIKKQRQVLVVTHNPNIVVHGDAELVIPLDVRGGQTRAIDPGGLQERAVRDEVCRIMEGGEEAFRRRYRRIIDLGPGTR